MEGKLRNLTRIVALLLFIFPNLSSSSNGTETCEVVYTLLDTTDTYKASCSIITFPCTAEFHAVSTDCHKYTQCDHLQIYQCPCGSGTKFDREQGQCVHDYEADCSCPPEPTSTTEDTLGEDKSSSTTIIIAVIVSVVALSVIIIIVICIYRKKKNKDEKNGLKDEIGEPTYNNISETYPSIDGAKSKSSMYHGGEAPPVPDRIVSVATDAIYDNNVTKETKDATEMRGTNEEQTPVVKQDSKRESCPVVVENDLYTSLKSTIFT